MPLLPPPPLHPLQRRDGPAALDQPRACHAPPAEPPAAAAAGAGGEVLGDYSECAVRGKGDRCERSRGPRDCDHREGVPTVSRHAYAPLIVDVSGAHLSIGVEHSSSVAQI